MSISGSLDRTKHFSEFADPLETQGAGVLTPAQRKALAVANLGITALAAELNVLAGVTAGTVTLSKALVVDANKDLSILRNLGLVNLDAGSSGVAGSCDIFPTTAAKGKLTLVAADSAGNTTTTITNASQGGARTYTIPDAGASGTVLVGGGNAAVALSGTGGTSTGTMTTLTAQVSTAAITTAGGASHVATITYTGLSASDMVFVAKAGGTNNATENYSLKAVITSNTLTLTIVNNTAATALNGTVIVNVMIVKA